MANIREAFEYAAKNPNSDFAKSLKQQAASGALDVEAKKYGLDLSPFKPAPEPEKRSLGEKVLDFTGGKEIAQGLGQALANPKIARQQEQVQQQQSDIQGQLLQRIKEKKAIGEDTSRLEQALGLLGQEISKTGQETGELLNQKGLTGKQVIGDALQLATTASAGSIGGGTLGNSATGSLVRGAAAKTTGGIAGLASGITGGTTGILRGAAQGALTGAGTGIVGGGLQGAAQGLQQDKDLGGVLKSSLGGATIGGISGGILGSLIGGISGGIQAKNLRKQVIQAQEQAGIRPSLSETVQQKSQTNPQFAQFVKDAKKQGYSDADINFLATVDDADKATLQKMFDLTAKAQSNPRQTTRAADILGENATNVVKQVQTQNSQAGKLVDQTAKALKGQSFDASPIEQKILNSLDELGISIGGDGKIDFSQSVFKNTPSLQKQIERVVRNIPDGSDAYQAHIFKKSVDELVDYGVGGEGLKGRSSSLLKSIRNAVDDTLDTNFTDYNQANTEYKLTKDFLNEVQGVVGKKVDFSTKQGSQAFGQAFRSAFSNNKSRPQTLKLIEDLQNIAKQRNLNGAEQNLLDQALYVNMLEEQFGSQAATGLAGEVGKAITKAKGFAGAVRSPLKATGEFIAGEIEKAQNISPETKKQLLKAFIQDKVPTAKALYKQEQLDNLINSAKKNLKNPSNAQGGFINLGGKSDDLINKAKKYKSAEDFVKAQGTPVYRGEGGSNVAQGKALLAEGKHFASDAEYPKGFGKVGEYVLKPNAKVLDLGDSTFAEISQKLGIPERSYISPKELSTIAKEKGYDVVKYTGEYKSTGKQFSHTVDLTGDSYVTKSQLTDIWKKANKK